MSVLNITSKSMLNSALDWHYIFICVYAFTICVDILLSSLPRYSKPASADSEGDLGEADSPYAGLL